MELFTTGIRKQLTVYWREAILQVYTNFSVKCEPYISNSANTQIKYTTEITFTM